MCIYGLRSFCILVFTTIFSEWSQFALAQCNFDPNCWSYRYGCTFANAFPFERKTPVTSCQQCMDICLQTRQIRVSVYFCQSAIYDQYYKTCDLFAVTASYVYRMAPCQGRTYMQPTGNPYCQSSTITTAPPPILDCPPGQMPIIATFKDSRFLGISGDAPSFVANVDECQRLCISNQDKIGNRMVCKMAQFQDGQCTLSPSLPSSSSTNNLRNSIGSYYYEKQCFSASMAGSCKSVILDPNHILVGYNQKTIDASTYSQCVQSCFDAKETFGFLCNSGQYFLDSDTLNCILNSETSTTQPDKYIVANDPVIYFEPTCGNSPSSNFGITRLRNNKNSLSDALSKRFDSFTRSRQKDAILPALSAFPPTSRVSLRRPFFQPTPRSIGTVYWSPWSECRTGEKFKTRTLICHRQSCPSQTAYCGQLLPTRFRIRRR